MRKIYLFTSLVFLLAMLPSNLIGIEGFYLVINPGENESRGYFSDWYSVTTKMDIYDWGRMKNLQMINDKGPVIDNKAFFVSKYGSKIVIKNEDLKKGRQFKAYFDFVTYRDFNVNDYPSRLKLTMFNPVTGFRIEKELKIGDIDERKLYQLDVPYELTSGGYFEILFREFSPRTGYWGIWDLIITDRLNLPLK